MSELLFANLDIADVEESVITAYERIAETTLYPGDPVRLFLEALAYVVAIQNQVIDLAGRQTLLAYAKGAHLDHIGLLMGVKRLPASAARLILRFSLASPLAFAVPIPKGTRATVRGGGLTFATLTQAVIEPGTLYIEVSAACVTTGAAANGLVSGQVNQLVDPLPYVAEVANTSMAMHGSEVEDDERLRERIRIAPESYTVAGSRGAYEARVLAVSVDIRSVSVTSPEPGVVDVRFLLADGEMPDAALIEQVRAALNAEEVRPLTDNVLVGAPNPVPYAIKGAWFLRRTDASLLATIQAAVQDAVDSYRRWQRDEPGRDIIPSRLIELVMRAGAKRVALESPIFTVVKPVEVARETAVDLVFGGLEDA